jgi:hypothetical protein
MTNSEIYNLAMKYFNRRGYNIEKNARAEGFSGILRSFDLLVEIGGTHYPVWVRDWKRTVGVNVVINIDKASSDAGYSNPILIADKFSDHAKAYANRRSIKLMTKSEVKLKLK